MPASPPATSSSDQARPLRSSYGFSWALPEADEDLEPEVDVDPHELLEALRRNINERSISADVAESMVAEFGKLLRSLPSAVIDLELPRAAASEDPRLVIVGDTHGQLLDVLHIFETHGVPSESVMYLFNGDIVDRGRHAVEIWLLIIAFKLRYPESVYILRGNHENEQMIARPLKMGGGFAEECLAKYSRSLLAAFQRVFKLLPLFAVVEQEVFVVHGGLFRNREVDLERLRALPEASWRRNYPNPLTNEQLAKGEKWSEDEEIIFDAQWADPHYGSGSRQSSRGRVAVTFGEDVTQRFLDGANLALCLRSHRVPQSGRGFELEHGGRLLTLFSASRYGGVLQNRGAVAVARRADGDRLLPGVDGLDAAPLEAVAARREARAAGAAEKTAAEGEDQEEMGGSSSSEDVCQNAARSCTSSSAARSSMPLTLPPPMKYLRLTIIEHLVDSPKALAELAAKGGSSSGKSGVARDEATCQVRKILDQQAREHKVSIIQQAVALVCAERERIWRRCRVGDAPGSGLVPRARLHEFLGEVCGEIAPGGWEEVLQQSAPHLGDEVAYGDFLAAPRVRWYHHGRTSLEQLAQATAQAELRLAGLASLFDSAKNGVVTPASASEAMSRLMPSLQESQRKEVATALFGEEPTSLSAVLHKLAHFAAPPELSEAWMAPALKRLALLIEKHHGPPPLHKALIRFFLANDRDRNELLSADEFVRGFQSIGAPTAGGDAEVPLLHSGRLYKLFSAIDSNSTGTVSFLELLIALPDREGRHAPALSEAPALEGEVPAMLLVHKSALLRLCRALDPKDKGVISAAHFLELIECLAKVLDRPLTGAARQRLREELPGGEEGVPYAKALGAASFEVFAHGGPWRLQRQAPPPIA